MNLKELVTGKPGDKQFLLGNEAAVRGVIEAGVSVAATYQKLEMFYPDWLRKLTFILSFLQMKK